MFETGRNEWHKHDYWPPKEATPKKLYFGESGKLSDAPPTGKEAFDEYVSDSCQAGSIYE